MDLQIDVARRVYGSSDTIGDMTLNGEWQCYTLEPTYRQVPGQDVSEWKIQNKTAIPVGKYEVILTDSPHFGRVMPLLVDVPGYEGVRIHWGNTAVDTDGCILVGQQEGTDEVEQSRAAFEPVYQAISDAIAAGGKVWVNVHNKLSINQPQAANVD